MEIYGTVTNWVEKMGEVKCGICGQESYVAKEMCWCCGNSIEVKNIGEAYEEGGEWYGICIVACKDWRSATYYFVDGSICDTWIRDGLMAAHCRFSGTPSGKSLADYWYEGVLPSSQEVERRRNEYFAAVEGGVEPPWWWDSAKQKRYIGRITVADRSH